MIYINILISHDTCVYNCDKGIYYSEASTSPAVNNYIDSL